jgi:hypothetical protein
MQFQPSQPSDADESAARPWRTVPDRVRWDELVLPGSLTDTLRSISQEVRQLQSQGGPGMVVLFTGERGTGKRTAARVLAGELGVRIIEVDTPTVCTRGPAGLATALWRLRQEASSGSAILLFTDAGEYLRDNAARKGPRAPEYAWDLVAQCSAYSGLTVISSRPPVRLEESAAGQIAHQVLFPFPEPDARKRLWRAFLADREALSDAEVDFIASAFMLSGGAISEIVQGAGQRAAQAARPVARQDLIAELEAYYEGRLASSVTREALARLRTGDTGR